MRTFPALLLIGLVLLVAGCGSDDGETTDAGTPVAEEQPATTKEGAGEDDEAGAAEQDEDGPGTELVLGDSEFGEMIFDASDQAIYVFERDTGSKSICYDECAAAWPPVLTKDAPVAGKGLDVAGLGTTERRDGSLQVTYRGHPLYYYAHEGPGEVRCHNVDLNGGFWWVVGPDGEPLT